jgi:hypothetical protein
MNRALILLQAVLLLASAVGSARAGTAPDTFSPVVSYQYQESLDEPGTATKISSAVVSYQYQEMLDEPEAATTVGSPVVSYQYYESLGNPNVTFTNSANVSYFFNGSLQITTPPALAAVVAGANAAFSVTANGTPAPTYQWQVSTDGGYTWTNVSGGAYAGTTTANLTITSPTTANLGYQYRAVITNAAATVSTPPVPLLVGTSAAKLTWLQNYFTADELIVPSLVGDLATPANDGIPNLLKYAFNLNPWTNGQDLLPQPALSGGNLTLTFPTPPSDVLWSVEASADLLNWSTTGVTLQPTGNQVTASYLLPGNTVIFLHIVIAPNP